MIVEKLKELRAKAYAPWSHFRVAAIAIDNDGKEFYGVNVENAAFPSGLCAERSALFGSVAYGGKIGNFKEIHIISSGEACVSPCAGCRQVITEFMPNDAKIFMYNGAGDKVIERTVVEMVPFPIRTEQIK